MVVTPRSGHRVAGGESAKLDPFLLESGARALAWVFLAAGISVACHPASGWPTAPAPPGAPVNLTAAPTAGSATSIDLRWLDYSTNEEGFEIERCTGAACEDFALSSTVGRDATGEQVLGLAPATTYRFRVRAWNYGGKSDYSNTATASTSSGAGGEIRVPGLRRR